MTRHKEERNPQTEVSPHVLPVLEHIPLALKNWEEAVSNVQPGVLKS